MAGRAGQFRRLTVGLAVSGLIGTGITTAWSAPASAVVATIHGCVNSKNGALTIPSHPACPAGTKALTWSSAGVTGPAGAPGSTPATTIVPGFRSPAAIAYGKGDIWVAGAASVSEVSVASGKITRVLSGASYGFGKPDALALDGTHLWVANATGNSVAEITANSGKLVKVVTGFSDPDALAVAGTHVWVANGAGNSVTGISISTGKAGPVLNAAADDFSKPDALASDGMHLWVANATGDSVTELDAGTGALVQVLSIGYSFDQPVALAVAGAGLWVVNKQGDSVTELKTSDGSFVVNRASGEFSNPDAIVAGGGDVWVASDGSGGPQHQWVTEIDASDAGWLRTADAWTFGISGPSGLAFDGSRVWVANAGDGSVIALPPSAPHASTPAAGSAPGVPAVIRSCVNGHTGAASVLFAPGAHCQAGARQLTWNKGGPRGPAAGAGIPVWGYLYATPADGFGAPDAIASDGADIWVANSGANSVTELDAATGAVVRVLSDASYGFAGPDALLVDGTHLWVVSGDGGSDTNGAVTEISTADGSLVRVLSDGGLGLVDPDAIAVGGGHIWVANEGNFTVTELNAGDGSLAGTITGAGDPVSDGTDVWLITGPNAQSPNAVTELGATTASVVTTFTASSDVTNPAAMALSGQDLWVFSNGTSGVSSAGTLTELATGTGDVVASTNEELVNSAQVMAIGSGSVWIVGGQAGGTPAIMELSSSNGQVLRMIGNGGFGISGTDFGFDGGDSHMLAVSGQTVWVTSEQSDSVTELPAPDPEPAVPASQPAKVTIRACASGSAGAVRILAKVTSSCPAGATTIGWPATGQAGPAGRPGIPGLGNVYGGASYGFDGTNATAFDGTDLWIANAVSGSVTEVNPATGTVVSDLTSASYGFDAPNAIAAGDGKIWVVNTDGGTTGSVTELNASTGNLIAVLSAKADGFNEPHAAVVTGGGVFVANLSGNSVTELNASTGALVRVISGAKYKFHGPDAMTSCAGQVWIASEQSVTGIKPSTGAIGTVLSGSGFKFSDIGGIACDGTRLWVTSLSPRSLDLVPIGAASAQVITDTSTLEVTGPLLVLGSHVWLSVDDGVTELNDADGSWVRSFIGQPFGSLGETITSDGTHVWATGGGDVSVTELPAG